MERNEGSPATWPFHTRIQALCLVAGTEGRAVLFGTWTGLVGIRGGAYGDISGACVRVKAQEVRQDEVRFVQQTPLVVSSVALCFGYELEEFWLENTQQFKPQSKKTDDTNTCLRKAVLESKREK